MIALFLSLLLLSIQFYPAMSIAGVCSGKLAASYASATAHMQYPKRLFEVVSAKEVTEAYFKEAGYDKKKIAEIKKYEPIEIYAVSLKSSDQ